MSRRSGLSRRARRAVAAIGLVTVAGSGLWAAAAQAATPTPKPTVYVANNGTADPLPKSRFRVQTWLIADADTGAVLAAQDPHRRMPPASALKLLTFYTMLPRLQADSPYTATKQDVAMEGSKVGLAAGSTYSVEDLYHGLFMPSGNDAASAVANAYGGWDRTLKAMNAEAQRLRARNTQARNPSGLDETDQYTSSYDLALIMRDALHNPDFRRIAAIRETTFPSPEPADGGYRGAYKIWTENRLLLNGYPGTLAGKTGFTSQAGRTFISAVKRNGRTLIVALMHSSFSTERSAEALFDWGFTNYDKVTPVGQLESPDPLGSTPVPRAAQVLDLDGNPVPGRNARLPDDELFASNAPTAATGISALAFLGWIFMLLVATIVILRIRVILLTRRRKAIRLARQQRLLVEPRLTEGRFGDPSPSQPYAGAATSPAPVDLRAGEPATVGGMLPNQAMATATVTPISSDPG